MNLKYYLRGLGIGVLVTALIMGIAGNNQKNTLSNEEIKAKAKELGMIESGTILEDAVTPTEEPKAIPTEDPEMAPTESPTEEPTAVPTEKPTEEPTVAPTVAPTEKPTEEPTVAPTVKPTMKPAEKPETKPTEEPSDDSDKKTGSTIIEVKGGEGSYTVCQKLEAAGLIASASDFDTYLCQNGYDKRVKTGTHEIPAGAEPEEIAQILAGQK